MAFRHRLFRRTLGGRVLNLGESLAQASSLVLLLTSIRQVHNQGPREATARMAAESLRLIAGPAFFPPEPRRDRPDGEVRDWLNAKRHIQQHVMSSD